MNRGLLLINLGTPSSLAIGDVRRYLREFLCDKRVIDLPALLRYILVYAFILPFRPQRSAHAYQAIWTEQGSPLLHISLKLLEEIKKNLKPNCQVALGMRYGAPSIQDALNELKDCDSITVLPLYPQYSSAASGSSIEVVLRHFAQQTVIPSLKVIRDFYQHPAYINAQAQRIKTYFKQPSHLLFSYHGIPQRQIITSGCQKECQPICPIETVYHPGCYKAQCHQTSHLLAKALNLAPNEFSSAFQSRLGKTPWIKPYTDDELQRLANLGIKNLTIVCPSFVTDCLETLEEIGIRARSQWAELGGNELNLIPCLNDNPLWIQALLDITQF